MEPSDFIEATQAVESIEVTRIACRELARLELTPAQIRIAERLGRLAGEEMKSQPAAVSL